MKKKLDIFNLFYSIGAVIILVGVIAKLLEWEVQDLFMTMGLTMEAIVFGASAVKYQYVSAKPSVAIDDLDTLLMEDLEHKVSTGMNGGNESVSGGVTIDAGFKNNQNVISQKVDTIYDLVVENQINAALTATDQADESSLIKSPEGILPPIGDPAPIDYLWQLDKMGLISVSKDIFYQPEWLVFNDSVYDQLADLMLRVFNKKLLSKKDLKTLYNYAIVIPVSTLSQLKVNEGNIQLSETDVALVYDAFKFYRYNGFFEQFVMEEKHGSTEIRNKKSNETQIFGGESPLLLAYCKQFYANEFVISPDNADLSSFIKVKDELLLDLLIKKLDVNNLEAYDALVKALFDKKDYIKLQLLGKHPKLQYDLDTDNQIDVLKSLLLSVNFLQNKGAGKDFIKNNLSFIKGEDRFTINDLIFTDSPILSYGPDNVQVNLIDLFDEGYLNRSASILELINLIEKGGAYPKETISDYMSITQPTSKQSIYTKFTNYIAKHSQTPNSKQLEYMSIHKKFNK